MRIFQSPFQNSYLSSGCPNHHFLVFTASALISAPDDESDEESGQDWVTRFLKGEHDLLWPNGLVSSTCPTLLTGLKMDTSDRLIDNLMEWERKFESANLEKHKQFLQEAQFPVCDSPLEAEATAWENGFVPETRGIPSDQLEFRIHGSLPPLAYMVSRPRQPVTAGEELMRRFDAGVRPYWLRDWQSGFGGYTKVYEYQVNGETCGPTTDPDFECLSLFHLDVEDA